MAISGNTVFEVRTTGSDLNGGGFVAGASGTDRSQQDAAYVVIDGITISATVHTTTTQITLVGYTVALADIGNILQITAGTATAGFYQITAADVPNNRWTLDRAAGTSTQTVQGRMGGCLASIGILGHANIYGANLSCRTYIKAGTYTLTTATPNVSGGPLALGGFCIGAMIEGYNATRGDLGAAPVIDVGAITSISVISGSGSRWSYISNIVVDGKNNIAITGITGTMSLYKSAAYNCSLSGMNSVAATNCYTQGCASGFTGCIVFNCKAKSCTSGFVICTGESCIATSCTSGFILGNGGGRYARCVAYACTDGFYNNNTASSGTRFCGYCVAVNCTGYGFRSLMHAVRCGGYNCTSGVFDTANVVQTESLSLTGNPFVDAVSENFQPNDTAGAGAVLRASGGPIWDIASYRDIGAVQHQDSGGAGFIGRPEVHYL